MEGFFRSRRKLAMAVGLLCLVVLGGVLLTGCQERQDSTNEQSSATGTVGYDAEALFKYKTPYVGDNSRVVNLISSLPFSDLRGEVSLQTQSAPYGVTVDYDFSGAEQDTRRVESVFRDNAVVMFALIDNVDTITFNARGAAQPAEYNYTRAEAQAGYEKDLREYSQDVSTLGALLKSLAFRVYVHPEKYALIMSSTPGIRIEAEYRGPAARARYAAEGGALFTWDVSTGKISKGLPAVELPLDTPVYWSPLDQDNQAFVGRETPVTVTILDEPGQKIDEKRLTILYDGELYYTVQPAAGIVVEGETPHANPTDLDEAVSLVVKSQSNKYYEGETATEGHIILDSEESGGTVKVYTIASYGAFGFENGVFTKISGSGGIPTVITFSRDENGAYSLLEYQEAEDGARYTDSIKEMFPSKLQERVLTSQGDYVYLVRQQEEQAAEYLGGIGRKAEISASYVEKQLVKINVNASNKLFAEYTKFDRFLNSCPYWIGTRERLENGVRFIYETSQGKTSDGCDLVVFRKTREGGALVEERQYKIVGGEPVLLGDGI